MRAKTHERDIAVSMRKEGHTYSEILSKVRVTKSTLSLWLRGVGLASPQQQRITDKRKAAQQRGAARRREMRIERTRRIIETSSEVIKNISRRELLLIGTALYWAEGTKQKDHSPSSLLQFANSDPHMIALYVHWLRTILSIKNEDIVITLYVHENHENRTRALEDYWCDVTRLSRKNLRKPVYKKHNPRTQRKNSEASYRGLVSISVKQSTDLNRRVQGWVYGIISAHKHICRVV